MIIIGYFLISIAKIFQLIVNLYSMVLAASVLISWIRPDPHNSIVRLIHQLTFPVYKQVRRILPQSFYRGSFDATPLIVMILLLFFESWLVPVLIRYGEQFTRL